MRRQKNIRRGDLVFIYPKMWWERIIANYDGKYCHVGIALSTQHLLSMRFRGVCIDNLDECYKGRLIDVYRVATTQERREEMIKFLISLMPFGRYDFRALLSFIMHLIPQDPRRFICSEFIGLGLFYIGLEPEALTLSPLQLANQPFVEYVTTIEV
jgi:hypothetical protein